MKLRRLVRNTLYGLLDIRDSLTGRRGPMVPPRRLMNVGSNSRWLNDFTSIGDKVFGYLKEMGGVKPTDRVLDIGCGVGRLAIPLTGYLTSGSYEGFDIEKAPIEYCQRVITSRFPNFRFRHADLFNTHYTPNSSTQPQEFRFPYPDNSFDFVFLTSVFTHMRHREVASYLAEIHRVLAPGGRCFATFFLLNQETDAMIEANPQALTFRHPMEHGRANNAANPDAAFAFDEAFIRSLYRDNAMQIERLAYGSWRGISSATGYQDTVVSTRTSPA